MKPVELVKGQMYALRYRKPGDRADRYAQLQYRGSALNELSFSGRPVVGTMSFKIKLIKEIVPAPAKSEPFWDRRKP